MSFAFYLNGSTIPSICFCLVRFIAALGKEIVEPVGEVEDGKEEREDESAYHVDSLRSAEIHLVRNAVHSF